jgi:hypothetical protein
MSRSKQHIDTQYIEWGSEANQTDREDPDGFREENNDLFDNPDVRQRVAELIAQSVCRAKKTGK